MTKKIVLVTSGQPSANPRLVKEAIALAESGFRVKVIYCPLSLWADEYDDLLFKKQSNISWIKAGYHPTKNVWLYKYARLRKNVWHLFYKIFGDMFNASLRSHVLFSQELENETKKHSADLYIGHNLGAIAAVVKAAKKFNAKANFDFEDFHRGEEIEGTISWKKSKSIEDKFTPFLHITTAASPLIAAEYLKLYPTLSIFTINNCFPLKHAVASLEELPTEPLKLFWFSQTVGKGRGLENVIEAIGKLKTHKIELTLLGNCSEEIKHYFISLTKKFGLIENSLKFISSVDEASIVSIASKHHIGLSTEVPDTLNREICLTNKIFMYLLAGNAIIFSKTKAHQLFLQEQSNIGQMFNFENAQALENILVQYSESRALLNHHREQALKLGLSKYNWNIEKNILLTTINKAIN